MVDVKKADILSKFLRKTLFEAGYTQEFILESWNRQCNVYGTKTYRKGFTLCYNIDTQAISLSYYSNQRVKLREAEIYTIATASVELLSALNVTGLILTPGLSPVQSVAEEKKYTMEPLMRLVSKPESAKTETKPQAKVQPKTIQVKIQSADTTTPEYIITTNKEDLWKDVGREMAKRTSGIIMTGDSWFSYRARYSTSKSIVKIKNMPNELNELQKEEQPVTLTKNGEDVTVKGKSAEYWAVRGYFESIGFTEKTNQIESDRLRVHSDVVYPSQAYEELWKILVQFSKGATNKIVPIGATVSAEALSEALWLTSQMQDMEEENLDDFNSCMERLYQLIPRINPSANDWATNKVSMQRILLREIDMLQALEIQLLESQKDEAVSVFDPMEIVVSYPTPAEEERLRKRIAKVPNGHKQHGCEFKAVPYKIFKLNKPTANANLETYQQESGHTKTEYLFHGSKTASWASILKHNMTCRPEQVEGADFRRSGSAYGNGLYFAGNPFKALVYTSMNIERSPIGVIGVFEVTNENPKKIPGRQTGYYTKRDVNDLGYDLVLAKGGFYGIPGRDEYIVYDDRNNAPRFLVIMRFEKGHH